MVGGRETGKQDDEPVGTALGSQDGEIQELGRGGHCRGED